MTGGDADALPPRVLHPAFHGSFDWHSCVHMHWLLARVLRRYPGLPQAEAIARTFDAHLSREAIAGEVAYLARPGTQSFERTYGWAWLLERAEELGRGESGASRRWRANLTPLADAFVARYLDYLPKARHPLRKGMPRPARGRSRAQTRCRTRCSRACTSTVSTSRAPPALPASPARCLPARTSAIATGDSG